MNQKNVIKITCSSEDRYKKIITLLSTLMNTPLSDKEIDVVDLIYKKGGEVTTHVRKEIRETLGISVEYMNNYIKRLRAKKILVGDKLHKSLSSFNIGDESQPYLLLFAFQTKEQANEEHAVRDSGSSSPDGA